MLHVCGSQKQAVVFPSTETKVQGRMPLYSIGNFEWDNLSQR